MKEKYKKRLIELAKIMDETIKKEDHLSTKSQWDRLFGYIMALEDFETNFE